MTVYGVDLSNQNGDPALYRGTRWYQQAQFVMAQAIPRGPTTTETILRNAVEDGKARGIYTWLWTDPRWRLDPNVTRDMNLRLATVPDDIELQMRPMLDFEDNISDGWRLVSIQQRYDDCQEALDVLHLYAAKRRLPLDIPGLYFSEYYANLLFEDSAANVLARLNGTPGWLAHYGRPPGSLIGGLVVGHQYTSTPADMDVFVDSEIVWAVQPQEDTVLIPDAYVTKFSLSDNHDVQGLIDNFEGVITQTREIAEAEGLDAEAKLAQIKAIVAA